MSNFPFNEDEYHYKEDKNVNGSPLTFQEARAFADKVLFWHAGIIGTGNFSEGNEGHGYSVNLLALGLVELLSDPNAIHRLETTGAQVKETINMVLEADDGIIERWDDNIKPMLEKFFKKE